MVVRYIDEEAPIAEPAAAIERDSTGSRAQRIPTLDGWRAVAILLVLLTHLYQNYLGHFRGERWLDFGQLGVSIFFVLSGYLITTNLLTQDCVNLRGFYLRRYFRLMPACWTFLGFLFLLTALSPFKVIQHDLWSCLFSFRNYIEPTAANRFTQHFWTLAVEEQFYLAWPIVLMALGRRNAAGLAGVGIVWIAVFRFIHWDYYTTGFHFMRTEVVIDKVLVGCLLAFLLRNERVRAWFCAHGRAVFAVAVALLAWDAIHFQRLIPLHEAVLIALAIGATAMNPTMWVSRMLEFRHMKTTGQISYSCYLWQGLFFRAAWGPWGILLTAIFAMLSWKLVEIPGIRLGTRILRSGADRFPIPIRTALGSRRKAVA